MKNYRTNKPFKNYQKKKYYTNRNKWSKSPYKKISYCSDYSGQRTEEIYYYDPQKREWYQKTIK